MVLFQPLTPVAPRCLLDEDLTAIQAQHRARSLIITIERAILGTQAGAQQYGVPNPHLLGAGEPCWSEDKTADNLL
jgi:hypothetical protein